MKLTKEQATENRRRIVDVAVRSFKGRGVDAVGLAEIMKSAGFTHGGFYNHFASKEALVVDAFVSAFTASVDVVERAAATSAAEFARALDSYLSVAHRDDVENGCPTSALVVDAARQARPVRGVYADGIARFLGAFESRMPVEPGNSREAAAVTLACMVGAMVLARGIGDANEDLSKEILGAVRRETAKRLES